MNTRYMHKILLLLLVSVQTLYSQRSISGTVTNTDKTKPIGLAVVKVKDTSAGSVSDSLGRFTILVRQFPAVLEVSHVSYESFYLELEKSPEVQLQIILAEKSNQLDDVIISTGYQQLPRERVTGSFAQIDNSLFNRRVSGDVRSRLEDVVPGLVFNRRRGANNISIRGRNTITGDGQPLIVVDNFPFEGDISSLNPNDVENVTVLRDAAAASIWGARAGNGVIVITTKQGSYRKAPTGSFNVNHTVMSRPDLYYRPQMSSEEYINWEQQLFQRNYYNTFENNPNKVAFTPVVELLIAQRNGTIPEGEAAYKIEEFKNHDLRSDLQKYLYQKGQNSQYSVAFSGGSEVQRYSISLGYDKATALLKGNDNERITVNANQNFRLVKNRLELNTGVFHSFQNENRNSPGNLTYTSIRGVTSLYPYARLADRDGNALVVEKNHRLNYAQAAESIGLKDWRYRPLEELDLMDNSAHKRETRLRAGLKYRVMKGLTAEINYLYQNSTGSIRDYYSPETYFVRDMINTYTQSDNAGNRIFAVPEGGILDRRKNELSGHSVRFQMDFNTTIKHGDFNLIAGNEIRDHTTETSAGRWYGYNDEYATSVPVNYSAAFRSYVNQGISLQIPSNDAQTYLIDRYISYYTNAAYNWKRRYIISASSRFDQSNLFGVKANQRGVPLWSTGLAWIVSEEGYFKESNLSYLKLRATYGTSGNVNKTLSALTTASFSPRDNFSVLPYATIQNPPNPDLQWERIRMLNLGLDFSSQNGKINGSVEYYLKSGNHLFGQVPYAPSSGITRFSGNTSSTKGRGVDVILNAKLVNSSVTWDVSALFSYVTDRVTDFKVTYGSGFFLTMDEGGSYVVEGKPQYAVYSYGFAGLDSDTGDPLGYLENSVSKDWSKIISSTPLDQLTYHGSARPVVFGAIRNNVNWKNLTVSVNVSYRLGYYFRRESVNYANLWMGLPVHGDYSSRWKEAGDEKLTTVPSDPGVLNTSRNQFYMYSSALVERGDHIRLQDIQLNYSVPKVRFGQVSARNLDLYAYVNNLGIIWKSTKLNIDPDYPMANFRPERSISVGLKLTI